MSQVGVMEQKVEYLPFKLNYTFKCGGMKV